VPDSQYAYRKTCPACGGENRPFASQCWLCHGELKGVPLDTFGPPAPLPSGAAPGATKWIGDALSAVLIAVAVLLVLLVLVVASIIIGLFVICSSMVR
jgi:hypothetical protein